MNLLPLFILHAQYPRSARRPDSCTACDSTAQSVPARVHILYCVLEDAATYRYLGLELARNVVYSN